MPTANPVPAANTRPPLPEYLTFSGKNLLATVVGIAFGPGAARNDGQPPNPQMAVQFDVDPEQEVVAYSVGKNSTTKPGEKMVLSSPYRVTYFKAITPNTIDFVKDALRACGWVGSSLKALNAGQKDGFGDTKVRLVVDINELDMNNNWRLDEDKKYRPQVEVQFVNPLAGKQFHFATALDDNALDLLDRQYAAQLSNHGVAPAQSANNGSPAPSTPTPSLPPGKLPF